MRAWLERWQRWVDPLVVLAAFVATRWRNVGEDGLRMDGNRLYWYWQYLDATELRAHLGRSLLYQHSQPPAFNALLGWAIKQDPDAPVAVLSPLFVLLGAVLAIALHALLRRVGVGRIASIAIAILFALLPGAQLYEQYLFYTHPIMVLLVLAALALHGAASSGRWWQLAAFALCIALVALTRAVFHLVWLGPALWLAARATRRAGGRRAPIVAICLCALLAVGSVYVKNAIVFGRLSASTWLGMSLAKMAVTPIDHTERRRLVSEGVLSPVSLVRPFSGVEDYPPDYRRPATDAPQVPVLTRKTRPPLGATNYNHTAFMRIERAYRRDALAMLRRRPDVYLDSVARAWALFLVPPSQYWALDHDRPKLGDWPRREAMLYGVPAAFDGELEKVDLEDPAAHGSYLWAALLLGALVWLGRDLLRARRSRQGLDPSRAVVLFAAGSVAFVAVAGTTLEVSENHRFRQMIEPLSWVLIAVAASRAARRARRGWRKAGARPAGSAAPEQEQAPVAESPKPE